MYCHASQSYPLRVRGLKSVEERLPEPEKESYPLRVRGLKSDDIVNWFISMKVVPLEGTWIEINSIISIG